MSNIFINRNRLKFAKNEKLSNTLILNFLYSKIIYYIYLCYHSKLISDILKNVQKIMIRLIIFFKKKMINFENECENEK